MSWEIHERRPPYTIWADNFTGPATIYAVTRDRQGTAVEPTGANTYQTASAAIATALEDDALLDQD